MRPGANFRKATSRDDAFPAQLQDALAVYAHLVFDRGFRDIILAGDSAGGNLALMLVQYLASLEARRLEQLGGSKSRCTQGDSLVLPTGLLLFSPWCDLTAATYGEALVRRKGAQDGPKHDIICASMATNSIRLFLAKILGARRGAKQPQHGEAGGVAALRGAHPWFSPCLPSAESSWKRVSEVYATGSRPRIARRPGGDSPDASCRGQSGSVRQPLRVLVTTGTTELFNLEIVRLCQTLCRAGGPEVERSGIAVELVSAEGEVHAFPLVPEWVSPQASEAWEKVRRWVRA